MKLPLPLLLVAAGAAGVSADQLVVKGGGTITGVLVQESATSVTIDVGAGRLTLPTSRVERIVRGTSALESYRGRALGLREDDPAGWLALGLWAQDQGLQTQAREAFLRVLQRDPGNATAQQALGNVRLGERWVSPEESYRAQGLVYYEGAWLTREERDFALREREAEARLAAAQRARDEAEARAREAEARASAAAAQARDTDDWGYPLDWVWAGGGGCCLGHPFPPRVHPPRPRPSAPPPAPPAERPSRSGFRTRVTPDER